MNRAGLLGFAGAANDNVILALQVETDSCIKNIDEILAVAGGDLLLLGQNDLCMSMDCTKNTDFPTCTLRRSWAPPPISFGEPRSATTLSWACSCSEPPASAKFLEKGFPFIRIGRDLDHILTQAGAHLKDMETASQTNGSPWTRRPSALI